MRFTPACLQIELCRKRSGAFRKVRKAVAKAECCRFNLGVRHPPPRRQSAIFPAAGIVPLRTYPSIGVKSWECQNPICPERSAFDRGKRFSVAALVKQKAIHSEVDQIPESSLRQWKLDVVRGANQEAILEMLVRHFTLHGDKILLVNGTCGEQKLAGRIIVSEEFLERFEEKEILQRFGRSAFFKRFMLERQNSEHQAIQKVATGITEARIVCGDCFAALSAEAENSLDGAVTSWITCWHASCSGEVWSAKRQLETLKIAQL